ncbi:methyltransferase [Amycolatopsis sp. NPDC059657]|uniref:methyltransferase n=1 Tax=Amycolatopsis sp. NPDC059657 TaxID=3346899 RepID=UPI00366EE390
MTTWTPDEFAEAVDGLAPVALRVAATLRIPDHIACGRTSPAEIAEAAGTDPDLLGRLLDFLACRGVVSRTEDGFGLTEYSVVLLDGHPARLRAWLDQSGVGSRMDEAVRALPQAVRTGKAPYPELYGTEFYADLAAAAELGPSFDELRGAHAGEFVPELAALDQFAVGSVVDVGGGTGTLAEALLAAHPSLRVTLVDLPAAVSAASKAITSSRFTPVAQSFFEPLPPGADVYTVVNVLHNWADEHAIRILRGCRDAGPATLVVERVTDENDPRTMTAMDLRAFLLCGGRERTVGRYQALGTAAGLVLTDVLALDCGLRVMRFGRG